jgi:hypothetical protein
MMPAIPTLVLGKFCFINNSCMIHELILNYAGYKDGVTPNKKYRKKNYLSIIKQWMP